MTRNSVIGVTGETGAGKSTVAGILTEYGGLVVDADKISHEVIKKGRPVYEEIIKRFGLGLLTQDGEIDRRKLGSIVFNNREALIWLEGVIHPRVRAETLEIIASLEERSAAFAVIDAPLLFESNMHIHCGSIWVVTAPFHIKEARIINRDHLTPSAARRRIDSRPGADSITTRADVVIVNDGGLEALTEKVREAFKKTLFT
jgi:dephospho-CoA kinase